MCVRSCVCVRVRACVCHRPVNHSKNALPLTLMNNSFPSAIENPFGDSVVNVTKPKHSLKYTSITACQSSLTCNQQGPFVGDHDKSVLKFKVLSPLLSYSAVRGSPSRLLTLYSTKVWVSCLLGKAAGGIYVLL